MSKVDIARQIRDNNYDCHDPVTLFIKCRDCPISKDCNMDDSRGRTKELIDAYIKRYSRKPTTDTFTESKFDNEPKEVEPKTLTTHIIKLKSDCVVMTEKEYDRLKKMEEDYNLIKKVLED